MSKPLWICTICGEDFTRKSSSKRHRDNINIHDRRPVIVRYIEYIMGLVRGDYPPPTTPKRLQGSTPYSFAIARNNIENFVPVGIPDISHSNVARRTVSYNTSGTQPSHQLPNVSIPDAQKQTIGMSNRNVSKLYSYSLKPLEQMSKVEKFQELGSLLNKLYTHRDAQAVYTTVHIDVYNTGHEDLLNNTLKHVRSIDGNGTPGTHKY